MMRTEITTTPVPIVTLAEAKTWLRVDHTADDDLIEDVIIPAAQRRIEMATGLMLSAGTEVKVEYTGIESAMYVDLPFAPVTSVELPEDSTNEGDTLLIPAGDTTVEYTCGYTTVPADLKLLVLNQIDWMYNNRNSTELAPAVKGGILLYTRNLMF